jgi:hypothetical protein
MAPPGASRTMGGAAREGRVMLCIFPLQFFRLPAYSDTAHVIVCFRYDKVVRRDMSVL